MPPQPKQITTVEEALEELDTLTEALHFEFGKGQPFPKKILPIYRKAIEHLAKAREQFEIAQMLIEKSAKD